MEIESKLLLDNVYLSVHCKGTRKETRWEFTLCGNGLYIRFIEKGLKHYLTINLDDFHNKEEAEAKMRRFGWKTDVIEFFLQGAGV